MIWGSIALGSSIHLSTGLAWSDSAPPVAVSGLEVSTFFTQGSNGRVSEVDLRVPYALIANPPSEVGRGPAGALAVVDFPKEVQAQIFLDHFEFHWEKMGYPLAVFEKPHFDLHFYGIPEREVKKVRPPDAKAPVVEAIPAGFFYPGVNECVPEMGVHAVRLEDLNKPFTYVLIMGFHNGRLTFIEPMATREFMMEKNALSRKNRSASLSF